VLAGDAHACVCANEPIEDRLERADAAVVGRVLGFTDPDRDDRQPHRLLMFEVTQRVKGSVRTETVALTENVVRVRVPKGTDCDLPTDLVRRTTGLLLTALPNDEWYATACSLVDPGPLVAAGGEPRGGVIKVVIGVGILGLVLLWALRRLRTGKRPDLPGAPSP
jgi:hypothetical protein